MKKSLAFLMISLAPGILTAQEPADGSSRTFATRLLITGSSDPSDPEGFQVYSAFTLEAALRRSLGHSFGTELSIRTESREIDSLVPSGQDRRLGSIELLTTYPVDSDLDLTQLSSMKRGESCARRSST